MQSYVAKCLDQNKHPDVVRSRLLTYFVRAAAPCPPSRPSTTTSAAAVRPSQSSEGGFAASRTDPAARERRTTREDARAVSDEVATAPVVKGGRRVAGGR